MAERWPSPSPPPAASSCPALPLSHTKCRCQCVWHCTAAYYTRTVLLRRGRRRQPCCLVRFRRAVRSEYAEMVTDCADDGATLSSWCRGARRPAVRGWRLQRYDKHRLGSHGREVRRSEQQLELCGVIPAGASVPGRGGALVNRELQRAPAAAAEFSLRIRRRVISFVCALSSHKAPNTERGLTSTSRFHFHALRCTSRFHFHIKSSRMPLQSARAACASGSHSRKSCGHTNSREWLPAVSPRQPRQ